MAPLLMDALATYPVSTSDKVLQKHKDLGAVIENPRVQRFVDTESPTSGDELAKYGEGRTLCSDAGRYRHGIQKRCVEATLKWKVSSAALSNTYMTGNMPSCCKARYSARTTYDGV